MVRFSDLNLDPRFGNNFIDANVLDRGSADYDDAVDRLLTLAEQGKMTLLLPYSVKAEIEHPRTPAEVKSRAAGLQYSIPVQLTAPERATHERIRVLIRGNAQSEQHANDAFHLVEAAKYGGRHFITNDRRLLRKDAEIWDALHIRVISPTDFIAEYYPNVPADPMPGVAAAVTRRVISPDELNRFLTEEIRKVEDLEDARLTFQYELREPDETGCNWDGAVLNPGSRGSPEYGVPHANAIVQKARQRFNVAK
jgi:predicted nucleic acid-binding protein